MRRVTPGCRRGSDAFDQHPLAREQIQQFEIKRAGAVGPDAGSTCEQIVGAVARADEEPAAACEIGAHDLGRGTRIGDKILDRDGDRCRDARGNVDLQLRLRDRLGREPEYGQQRQQAPQRIGERCTAISHWV
jgi:hypothetical protein